MTAYEASPFQPDVVPGGDPLLGWIVERIRGTGAGTNAGVTVTLAARAGLLLCCTGIQVSGDAAALVTLQSPASTTIWQLRESAAYDRTFSFPPGMMFGEPGRALVVNISASTAACEANLQAFAVNYADWQLPAFQRMLPRMMGGVPTPA